MPEGLELPVREHVATPKIRRVPIFFSERRFEVVTWGVGHKGLLLRTLEDRDQPRIEVWFKPAYAACLSSVLDGVHITDPRDAESRGEVERQIGRELNHWEHIYAVVTPSARGWVVAGSVSGRQDHRRNDEPTMFDGWEPRDGVEVLFSVNVG